VSNSYARSVDPAGESRGDGDDGSRFFEVSAANWRGLGVVPASGLRLRPEFVQFDAAHLFEVDPGPTREHKGCRCGDVLRGTITPARMPFVRPSLHTRRTLGPCMVSARRGVCGLLPVWTRSTMSGDVILLAHGSGGTFEP